MNLALRIAMSLAAAAAPWAANAADYDPIVEEVAEYVPVEVGSGWYLRGDVGYAVQTDIGQVSYRTFDPVSGTYGSSNFATGNLDDNFTFGGGFGYRLNEWIRGDATLDGFRATFNGSTASGSPCVDPGVFPAYAGTGCRSEDGSEVSVVSLMANGYVDLGTFVGLTPYVGAGVGYSFVSWEGLNSLAYCVDGGAACPAPGGAISASDSGGVDGWRFTYALMAGVAYDLSNNFKLDLGYKYRHIKGGDMFAWDAGTAAAGATGTQGFNGDIDQHEIKVGLRYELW